MIKVALIGAHGTGKTTICHELVSELKKRGLSAHYLVEIAREARKAGFKLNEGTTKESQEWILHTQMAKELEFGAAGDVDFLVCDRSVLDNYIYYLAQFGKHELLDSVVDSWTKTYSFLFKVPINNSYLTPDKVRSTDPVFQKKIDELIEKELKERGIAFHDYTGVEPAIKIILGEKK